MAGDKEVVEAVVTNIMDPEMRGRIKVKSGALLSKDTEWPDWVEPCFPFAGAGYGWFFLPQIGDVVELELTTGHTEDAVAGQALLMSPRPKWRCCFYTAPTDFPPEFKAPYGMVMGIKTPMGQILMFNEALATMILQSTQILLGGPFATQPLVLGTLLMTFLAAVIDILAAHTHNVPGITPGGGSTESLLPTQAADLNFQKALWVDSGLMLSLKTKTE